MRKVFVNIVLILAVFMTGFVSAQTDSDLYSHVVKPRARIIIDNDFCGDPDGLYQLVQHILSPSVEIKAIIGSHLYSGGFYGVPGTAKQSCVEVNELLKVMKISRKIPVLLGAESGLIDLKTPSISEGSKLIVDEAMKDDKTPLFVVCGAGLTTIASAYLLEPKIAERVHLVWIGGPEYATLAMAPPQGRALEYNLGIDIQAAQVIFNSSDIPLWQVPRNVYRQALFSYSEIYSRLNDKGSIGKYLIQKLDNLLVRAKRSLGEAYVLGDSPLVLLTSLQSAWEIDPSSSNYVIMQAPHVNAKGLYEENPQGRKIRVYTQIDNRLMWEDLVSKLAIKNSKNKTK